MQRVPGLLAIYSRLINKRSIVIKKEKKAKGRNPLRCIVHNATAFLNRLRRFLAKDAFYLLTSKVTSDVLLEIIDFLVFV